MKWTYETVSARHTRLYNWHKWFAWHPVYDEHGTAAWLQTVDRKLLEIRRCGELSITFIWGYKI